MTTPLVGGRRLEFLLFKLALLYFCWNFGFLKQSLKSRVLQAAILWAHGYIRIYALLFGLSMMRLFLCGSGVKYGLCEGSIEGGRKVQNTADFDLCKRQKMED